MEVIEKGKILAIRPGKKFPIKEMIIDAGIVLLLVWVVFAVLVLYFSKRGEEILPYFIGITLLLLVPLVSGILARQSRHYREALFDGNKELLSLKGLWRWRQLSFNEIGGLQISKYRYKKRVFLYRFEVVLTSGKTLRLIQDVPHKEALCKLGEKARDLVNKPLHASG